MKRVLAILIVAALVVLVLAILVGDSANAITAWADWYDPYTGLWGWERTTIEEHPAEWHLKKPLLTFNGRYTVAVNYDLPLEEMIRVSGYVRVNQCINALNFPITERGLVNTEVTILKLNGNASTKEILAMMERNGFRPATLAELLALGASFHDLRSTAALGSVWRESWGSGHCSRHVVTLVRCGTRRDSNLRLRDTVWDWSNFYQFAAVRIMSVKIE